MKSKRRQVYEDYLRFSQQSQSEENVSNPMNHANREDRLYENDINFQKGAFPLDYDNEVLDDEVSYKQVALIGQRAKYSARIDRFLNNCIIITGVLLLVVLAIAFLI